VIVIIPPPFFSFQRGCRRTFSFPLLRPQDGPFFLFPPSINGDWRRIPPLLSEADCESHFFSLIFTNRLPGPGLPICLSTTRPPPPFPWKTVPVASQRCEEASLRLSSVLKKAVLASPLFSHERESKENKSPPPFFFLCTTTEEE